VLFESETLTNIACSVTLPGPIRQDAIKWVPYQLPQRAAMVFRVKSTHVEFLSDLLMFTISDF